MPDQNAFRLSPEVAGKWHALSVRRRDHLAELYHSGRWRRYFSEQSFISLMRETVHSVERWGVLAQPRQGLAASEDLADASAQASPAETPAAATPDSSIEAVRQHDADAPAAGANSGGEALEQARAA